jgi:TatD DNase family protein
MELADSHVHLDRYQPPVVSEMLARARWAQVKHFLAVGVNVLSSVGAVHLARRERGVLAAVGVHPTRAEGLDLPTTMAELRILAQQPQVAAIGEVGLDDAPSSPPSAVQEALFTACIDLADELDLPLSLHIVGAHRRAQEMIAGRAARRAVVHYFQGNADLATAYLALGCFISVGKPVTRPDRVDLRQAVKCIPLSRLLLETDTYPLPGRTTEPRDVVEICRSVAELLGRSFADVADATSANYRYLFVRDDH